MAGSPEQWFNELPPVTKVYLISTFMTTVLLTLGFLDPANLGLDFWMIWNKFQIWRFVTSFICLGGFGMGFLFALVLLVRYSTAYEQNPFRSGGTSETADYVFMLMFGISMMSVISYFLVMPFMARPLIFMIVYVWSRMNAGQAVKLFGFALKGIHIPWAFMAIHILLGSSPVGDLIGISVGHMYYFLLEILPVTHGTQLLSTPEFVSNMFESAQYSTSYTPAGERTQAARPASQSSHRWGSGRPLGTPS